MKYEIINYETLRLAVDGLCDFLFAQEIAPERVFDSRLIAYELLGNVLKHADGNAKLDFGLTPEFVELKIVTAEVFFPAKKETCSDVYAESGRGLFLVDRLAERFITDDGVLLIRIKR